MTSGHSWLHATLLGAHYCTKPAVPRSYYPCRCSKGTASPPEHGFIPASHLEVEGPLNMASAPSLTKDAEGIVGFDV